MICTECLKWISSTWAKSHRPPYLHCHHEEQLIDYQKPWQKACDYVLEEKPKEQCWCEQEQHKNILYGCVKFGKNLTWDILFCPHCGCKHPPWLHCPKVWDILFCPHCGCKHPPWWHCHHKEPLEKPKEKCWCRSPNWRKYVLSEIKWTAIYCPLCGLKL